MNPIDGIILFLVIVYAVCWLLKIIFLGKTAAAVFRRQPEDEAERAIRKARRR